MVRVTPAIGVRGVHPQRVLTRGRGLAGVTVAAQRPGRRRLEVPVFNRRRAGANLSELVQHSERGAQGQYLSMRYSQRLADNNIVAPIGSKGDRDANAMTESFNGLYK
jgi:transposase InsO family protein